MSTTELLNFRYLLLLMLFIYIVMYIYENILTWSKESYNISLTKNLGMSRSGLSQCVFLCFHHPMSGIIGQHTKMQHCFPSLSLEMFSVWCEVYQFVISLIIEKLNYSSQRKWLYMKEILQRSELKVREHDGTRGSPTLKWRWIKTTGLERNWAFSGFY